MAKSKKRKPSLTALEIRAEVARSKRLSKKKRPIDTNQMSDRLYSEGLSQEEAGGVTGEADLINLDRMGRRAHLLHPPAGTAGDQSEGFHAVLVRLYQIEDASCPVGGNNIGQLFAEARAVCERFLPPSLADILRKRYG